MIFQPEYQYEPWKGRIIVIQKERGTDGTEPLNGINWTVVKLWGFDIVSMCGRN